MSLIENGKIPLLNGCCQPQAGVLSLSTWDLTGAGNCTGAQMGTQQITLVVSPSTKPWTPGLPYRSDLCTGSYIPFV